MLLRWHLRLGAGCDRRSLERTSYHDTDRLLGYGPLRHREQQGLYGPLVIEPRAGYRQAFDRDYVVFLSDWSDQNPHTIMSNLKFQPDYYNFHQRTLGTFVSDVSRQGLADTISDRLMRGEMRMSPTDILDISGATYTYLIKGQPPAANCTALFRPGGRVRLRFIATSSIGY